MFHCKKWVGRLKCMEYCAQMSTSNFIIATALANTAHEKFYEVDLPALEDVCPGLCSVDSVY